MSEQEQVLGEHPADGPEAIIAARLRKQADWCERLGSGLYAYLLERTAADVLSRGPCWEVLRGHESDPEGSALALRFMGAVHRTVLKGEATELARHYPSAGGEPDMKECWAAFLSTVAEQLDALRELVTRPVQTNEVGRCRALIGGFLLVSRLSRLPLRLLEIGTSAGLNLRWDQYYYQTTRESWGDKSSPVHLTGGFIEGHPSPFSTQARIVERRGCDRNPLNPETKEGELTLLSFVWADQTERLKMLRGAIEVARKVPATVEAADAPRWLKEQLRINSKGAATVVFHSIVWQYMSEEARSLVIETLEDAGRRADSDSTLAWLRMEPGEGEAEVWLKVWPGGEERLLATAGYHGRDVRWLIDS